PMQSIGTFRPRAASLSLITAGVLWGTGGLAGAMLSERAGLSSTTVAVYRLLLGGVFALLFLGGTGRLRALPRTAEAVRRLLAAGTLLAVFQACYFGAVALTSVGVATMVTIGSVPVFVALASTVLDRIAPGLSPAVRVRGGGADVGRGRQHGRHRQGPRLRRPREHGARPACPRAVHGGVRGMRGVGAGPAERAVR